MSDPDRAKEWDDSAWVEKILNDRAGGGVMIYVPLTPSPVLPRVSASILGMDTSNMLAAHLASAMAMVYQMIDSSARLHNLNPDALLTVVTSCAVEMRRGGDFCAKSGPGPQGGAC